MTKEFILGWAAIVLISFAALAGYDHFDRWSKSKYKPDPVLECAEQVKEARLDGKERIDAYMRCLSLRKE